MQRSTIRRTQPVRSSMLAGAVERVIDRLFPKRAGGAYGRGTVESLEGRVLMSGNFPSAVDNALGYDAAGNLHVTYYDAAERDLKYAVQTLDGTWSAPVTVDANGNVGQQVSLAVGPQGQVGVAYFDATHADLKYAQLSGGQWNVATVDAKGVTGMNPSLVFNAAGVPEVSYFRAQSADLKLAKLSNAAKNKWKLSTISAKGAVGEFSSLAINPATGLPSVAFADSLGRVQFAAGKKNGFAKPVVVDDLSGAPGSVSLAFDTNNRPAIGYYDSATGQVKLARPAGKGFATSAVGTVSAGRATAVTLLFEPGTGAPQIVFDDTATQGVFLASGDGSGAFTVTQVGTGMRPKSVRNILDGTITFTAVDTSGNAVLTVNSAVGNPAGGPTVEDPDSLLPPPQDVGQTPARPSHVVATGQTETSIDIAWTDNSAIEAGFVVERSIDGVNFTPVGTVGANTTAYHDSGLTEGVAYWYRVRASGADGSSSPYPTKLATNARPTSPQGLAAAAVSGNAVALSWTDLSAHESGFRIQRSGDGGSTWSDVGSVGADVTSFTDTTAQDMHSYVYRVFAVAGTVLSAVAPTAAANTPVAGPSGLSAFALSITGIALQWTDTSSGETGFEIQRSPDGSSWATIFTTAPNVNSYMDANLAASATYYYRVRTLAASGPSDYTAAVGAQTAAVDAPHYMLTPSVLASVRAKAAANTPQWQAFKGYLDAHLNQVTPGAYEGWELPDAGNYALGYQVLKDSDPATASAYADKAIAIMLMGLRDNLRDASASRMFLARGDGSTRSFTLPNTGINSATFQVWTPTVSVEPVTKGAANGQDTVSYGREFLKVSNTPDGPADYAKGVDWRYNPDYLDGMIDWSLQGGQEPATGATYYVTDVSSANTSNLTTGYTLSGNALTFAVAPAANQAIYVEYQYDTPTLRFQQTGDGRGGFNNVFIDSGYTTRNLKYIAIGLDWLWQYQGMSPAVRTEAMDMLVRWHDNLLANGYSATNPNSNYGAGTYALLMSTAIALQGRDAANAARLMTDMQNYHTRYVLPILQAPANGIGTQQGGFWAEGWGYGPGAIQNIVTTSLAFENAGWGSAAAERAWSKDVITAMLTEQPTASTIYDGGDGYTSPRAMPGGDLLSDLAYASGDPAYKGYANWVIAQTGGPANDWEGLLFQDPSAPAAFWGNNVPLQYLSPGTGLAVARKDWSYASTWLSFHAGNSGNAGHESTDQGGLEINRGADALLVNTAAVTEDQNSVDKSTYGNLLVVDDGGAGEQTYRYAEGFWYGNPGVTMPHYEGSAAYTYAQGDYAAAYRKNTGDSNPATELVRDVFYVRDADYVITYDRATTTHAEYLKQVRWHFSGNTTVSGDSWTVTSGSSKLFGKTYSDAQLTTSQQPVTIHGVTVQEVSTNNASPAASVQYVTAMQVAPSAAGAMDSSAHVESGDGKVEGVEVGAYVVLFGRHGAVSGGTGYSVTAAPGQVLTHYISDLTPGATYSLTGANQGSAVASAQGVLTFITTGTGSPQAVALAPGQANVAPVVENQTVNVAAAAAATIGLDATDPDGDLLTYQLTGSVGNGTLSPISADGHVTFTPSAGFTGTAWFTYTATDGRSAPVAGAVTLNVYTPHDVVINIADGQTYQLTGNLTGFTSLTINGAGPNSVLEGNGFQIFNDNLLGKVTISNVRLHNVGKNWIDPATATLVNSNSNYAIYLVETGDADVTIQDTTFDASSSVYLNSDVDSTAAIRRNTVLSNSLAPGGVRPDVSAAFFEATGWQSKQLKAFEGNRIYESYLSFGSAKDWQITGNVIDGDRGGITVSRSDGIEIANNYIHAVHDFSATDPGNPYGSQVSNLAFSQSTNVSTHDNVLRDGEWMVRGLDGDFYNNLLLDLESHDWIINPESGAKIHDNIFAPRYDGQIVGLVAGIRLYDPSMTGVEIYNNTFDAGAGFTGPAIDIGPGVTLGSLRSNLFYDFPVNWSSGNAVIRPGESETLSGSPPRPATDPDRIAYANFNAFYNPNAAPGTVNFAVGVDGAVYNSPQFGSGDVSGVSPMLKAPPASFPFAEADIKSGAVSVAQILAVYRDGYTPLSGSPLINAADPQDAAAGRRNIGAVQ